MPYWIFSGAYPSRLVSNEVRFSYLTQLEGSIVYTVEVGELSVRVWSLSIDTIVARGGAYLPLHRSEASHLPKQLVGIVSTTRTVRPQVILSTYPVIDLPMFTRTIWERDPVVFVISVNEVLHDRSALEQLDDLAIFKPVRQSRDSSIGIDLKEPWFLFRVSTRGC